MDGPGQRYVPFPCVEHRYAAFGIQDGSTGWTGHGSPVHGIVLYVFCTLWTVVRRCGGGSSGPGRELTAFFFLNWRPWIILIRDLVHCKRKLGGYTDQQNETTDGGRGMCWGGWGISQQNRRTVQNHNTDDKTGWCAWTIDVG